MQSIVGASSVYAPRLMPNALPAEGGHRPPQGRENFWGVRVLLQQKVVLFAWPWPPTTPEAGAASCAFNCAPNKAANLVWGLVWEALATHRVSASPPFRPFTCACGRNPFRMLWLHMECDGNARRGGGGSRSASTRRRNAGGSSIHVNHGTGHHETAARTSTDTRSARRMSRCPPLRRYETRR